MSDKVSEPCNHQEVAATGGWCSCGTLVKFANSWRPVALPSEPAAKPESKEKCWKCAGTGQADNAQFTCSACHGSGYLAVVTKNCTCKAIGGLTQEFLDQGGHFRTCPSYEEPKMEEFTEPAAKPGPPPPDKAWICVDAEECPEVEEPSGQPYQEHTSHDNVLSSEPEYPISTDTLLRIRQQLLDRLTRVDAKLAARDSAKHSKEGK